MFEWQMKWKPHCWSREGPKYTVTRVHYNNNLPVYHLLTLDAISGAVPQISQGHLHISSPGSSCSSHSRYLPPHASLSTELSPLPGHSPRSPWGRDNPQAETEGGKLNICISHVGVTCNIWCAQSEWLPCTHAYGTYWLGTRLKSADNDCASSQICMIYLLDHLSPVWDQDAELFCICQGKQAGYNDFRGNTHTELNR